MQSVTERPLFNNIIAQRREILTAGRRPKRLSVDNASLDALDLELRQLGYSDVLITRRVLGLDIEISPTPNFEVCA